MKRGVVDPGVQALLDEANLLPECAAQEALLLRAAWMAESMGDLDTAWQVRCRILSSSEAHGAPKFENLFLCLAWCLAMSDREPLRFSSSRVLWQYKWVATDAPRYARVPRSVLERLIEDMDARFVREGWGRRAGLHKRIELHLCLGEPEQAKALVPQWRATPRDRGADCSACEASSLAELLIQIGDDEQALREARPIIQGRLSCATVPHSTFGDLLEPLTKLGRHAQARELYDKGRRLVAQLESSGVKLASPYLLYAAYTGDLDHARAILRARLAPAAALRADSDRLRWFARAAVGLEWLAHRGAGQLDLPPITGLTDDGETSPAALAVRCHAVAVQHAQALDCRNGNNSAMKWIAAQKACWSRPSQA